MRVEWNESFFDVQQEYPLVYWVCFWTGDDIEEAAKHDPQRMTGAASVEDILHWVNTEKGARGFELFVETVDHRESPELGWTAHRNLIRLAGDFRPRGTATTIDLTPVA